MTSPLSPLSVRLAATFTAEPLQTVLESWLREFGFAPDLEFAPFNQVLQQLLDPGSLLASHGGGMNVVLVRACDLSADQPARARSAAREVGAALAEAATRDGAQTLVVVCPAADGADVEATFLADLRDQLGGVSGVELLAVSEWMEAYPVAQPFDAEAAAAACVPFSEEMFAAIATMIARRLLSLRRKPYKVIAVDCDHTLWTGVCGEAGPKGVLVDGPRRAFQEFLLARRAEGYLLCLVSKNHPEDVEAVFRENRGMVITRDAFVGGMINWDPKSSNLRRLAERLDLGLDSFAFLDDNPAEIAEVEANAPAVLSLRIPEDTAALPAFLRHLWVLDRTQGSDEDALRADFYHDEARRLDLRERASSYESFIDGLELKMDIEPVTEDDISRASQLTQRTNQFNACPQPRDEAALMLACRGMRAQLVKVSDRFGDYGSVGLMCTREDSGRLWAETFLLSCRALGKGVEQRMLRYLGELATELKLSELAIWFNDTGRNQPVREFLESIPGTWDNGVRVIPVEAATTCALMPIAARSAKSVDEVTTPLADPALTGRIANELRSVQSVMNWATPPLRPRPHISERMVAPQGEVETAIAGIWSDVLGLEAVGRADRFVDLGGSSIQLVRVHARMQREFGVRFDLVRMFENPTVAAQAGLVSPEQSAAAPASTRDSHHGESGDALAIVGMSLRLPDASSPEELWKNLCEGKNSITHFDPKDADVPVPSDDPDFVCARGLLDPEVYEGLDGGLFGILPREAEMIDPQQRVFLELCWEALERGGYVPDDAEKDGGRIGIYAGCYYGTYLPHHILSDPEYHRRHLAEAQVGALSVEFGNDKDHLATRVAFKLNLKGPSLTVQTACSSSLVAVAHAAMALRTGQCDMALAGGVTVTVPQKRGYHHEEGGMLSKDGRCRPFDAESSGTVFSNGAGCVLLKRLDDAVRDGDHIHAVVRGFGMNNDGGVKHSYAAPSVEGQADAIRRAHRDAGVDARTVSYIEAHGTATPLGDPIEVTGLTQAFRASTADTGFCAIGSLKSNLGHLDTAAGVCGLIKTAMSLEKGKLPAVLHFEKPNPRIDFANSPFFVNDQLRDWNSEEDAPRRAGVSSFGVGGTNVHVVVEEAPRDVTPRPQVEGDRVWLLSGRTDEAVDQLAARMATFAEQAEGVDFAAAARTMSLGRKAMGQRASVVAHDWKSLAEKLGSGRLQKFEAAGVAPQQVWMFPGQGAQHPGMTSDLYQSQEGYRHDVDFCADFLKPLLGEDLRTVLFAEEGGDAAERLKHTVLAQPAIFVVEWALARQWARWGSRPEIMIGHSVGEFTAACLAGVFSVEDGLRILAERGKLMGEVPGGSMLSVRLAADELRERLPAELDLAAINGPELCVVAGESSAVAAFAATLEADGINVRELHTSHAFHSRMMDSVVPKFRQVIERVHLHAPKMSILSTVTGEMLDVDQATDPGYWAGHLRETVNFHGAIEAAAALEESRIYLEVGPGQTLTTLARQTAGRRAVACISTCEHPASGAPDGARMLQSLGDLWARGVDVDWAVVHGDASTQRVPLPTYPFQRRRAWLECKLLDRPLPAAAAADASESIATEIEVVEEAAPVGFLARVGEVLENLSGIPADEMTPQASFLELGFDSLLLTQAARELQKAFGVPIAFRDLMQNYPTLEELVKHLEANSTVEVAASGAKKVASKQAAASEVVSAEPEEESGVSGPRTRIDRVSTGDELTPKQREHLDALVASYCERTRKSKDLTQEHRQWHADARTVNGFNRLWKEMVYQVVATKMQGCKMWDVDGNEYVDMVNGFGPNFLGHAPAFVTEAIQEQLATGLEIGPQCEVAMETAKLFCEVTGNERVCFLNTGSEAVQAAMRIARTVTGREKILVFDKDYHGNFDPVLVRSVGKGSRRRTLPLAPGIPDSAVQDVIVVPWGKPEALEMIREVAGELAAVLVEPVQSRQPEMVPIEFVREVKKISEENDFLLVFDEVITGIRQGPRGAQELYGIEADLATYGKVFGGGALPIGIVGGKSEYMDTFDGGQWQYGDDSFPEKDVTFFAGTFVRLPLAMAACRAVLKHVQAQPEEYWTRIGERADRLAGAVDGLFRSRGVDVRMVNFNSQMYLRIGDGAKHGNLIYYHLRKKGVFAMEGLPFYLNAAHTDADVDFVIRAFRETIDELQAGGFLEGSVELVSVDAVDAPTPTTEAQREIFHAVMMGDELNCAFNESNLFRFDGELNAAAMKSSIEDLVERHPALRSTFSADGTTQTYLPGHSAFEWTEHDFTADPSESQLKALMGGEMERPFDLVSGPLLRVHLVKLAEDRHGLIFTAHHMVCDGWSFTVVHHELATAYNSRRKRVRPVFAPVMSFAGYAEREARDIKSPERQAAEQFWVGKFEKTPPVLDLPTDRPRPQMRTHAGAMVSHAIDLDRVARLKSASPRLGGTLFATLFSCFSTLLHRLTGQDDVVVGVPAAGQARVGSDHLIGHCLNFLPLRVAVEGDTDFRALAASSRDDVLEAYENQDYTWGTLLQQLSLPRDTSRPPLVSVMFNLEKSDAENIQFDGLDLGIEVNPHRYVNFELFFNLVQTDTGLVIECEYNSDLFDESTILRWLAAYEQLIEGVIVDGDACLDALPLVNEEERAKLLIDWNATEREIPAGATVHGMFAETAAAMPERTALRCGEEALSYAELRQRVSDVAAVLQTRGVRQGDLIGVHLERSVGMVASLLAILECGAAYVPMDPEFPADRLALMVEDSDMKLILSQRSVRDSLPQTEVPVLGLDEVPTGGAFVPADVNPESTAYVIFTSGSTGRPKGVRIPHHAVVNFLNSMRREPGLNAEDVLLSVTTLSFDIAGLEIFLPLTTGACTVIADRDTTRDGLLLAKAIEDHQITCLQATPVTWRLLLEGGWSGSKGLKVLVGGEAVPRELVNRLAPICGEVWNVYGPTETTIWSTVARVDSGEGPVSIGRPIDNTQVHVVSPAMELQPVGVAGELLIGGDGLAEGYHRRDELTADRFVPSPFGEGRLYRTGDLARWNADGTLECLGRMDHQVKVRGFRIELGEIETLLEKHVTVEQAAVHLSDERIVACVRANENGSDELIRTLRGHLQQHLPDYMIPAAFVFLSEFPLTPNGKVDRKALPGGDAAAAVTREPVAPRTENERLVLAVWQDVMKRDDLGVEDDIFEMGGDSIQIFQIAARLSQQGMTVTPADVFRGRTVARLAQSQPEAEVKPQPASTPMIQRVNRDAYRRIS